MKTHFFKQQVPGKNRYAVLALVPVAGKVTLFDSLLETDADAFLAAAETTGSIGIHSEQVLPDTAGTSFVAEEMAREKPRSSVIHTIIGVRGDAPLTRRGGRVAS
jgi:hypothetical protein